MLPRWFTSPKSPKSGIRCVLLLFAAKQRNKAKNPVEKQRGAFDIASARWAQR